MWEESAAAGALVAIATGMGPPPCPWGAAGGGPAGAGERRLRVTPGPDLMMSFVTFFLNAFHKAQLLIQSCDYVGISALGGVKVSF